MVKPLWLPSLTQSLDGFYAVTKSTSFPIFYSGPNFPKLQLP